MVVSPYLGLLIVQGNFNFALGVLGFAAVTDLVSVFLKLELYRFSFNKTCSWMVGLQEHGKASHPKWAVF